MNTGMKQEDRMAWRYQDIRERERERSSGQGTDPLQFLLGAELIHQQVATVVHFGEGDMELPRDGEVILLSEGGGEDIREPGVRVK